MPVVARPTSVACAPWTTVHGRVATAPACSDRASRMRWNGACSIIGVVRATLHPVLLGLAVLAACDRGLDDELEEIVANRSAQAVSAKTNLTLLAEKFAGEPELAGMTVDEARARAVELVENELRQLAFVGCERELVADPMLGTIDAAVVDCRIGVLRIDGQMHAQVEIETASCDTGACPSAVVWTLEEFDLEIGTGDARPHLSGTVVLRDPVDAALPMSWETGDDFVLDNRLGSFATRSTASWRITEDRCVENMQLEARLDRLDATQDDPDADLEPQVGQIVVSAQDVARCPGKCATSGEVRLAFGRGRVLEWDFAGQIVDVLAPGGHTFTTTLVCNE